MSERAPNKAGNEVRSITVALPERAADADLAEVLAQFTNLIMNERVRAFNEGVDSERERCAAIAEACSDEGRDGHQIAKVIREHL